MSLSIELDVHNVAPVLLAYVYSNGAEDNMTNNPANGQELAIPWSDTRSIVYGDHNETNSLGAASDQASKTAVVVGLSGSRMPSSSPSHYPHQCNSTAVLAAHVSDGAATSFGDRLWSFGLLIIACVIAVLIVWKALCLWWRNRHFRSSQDLSSDLMRLPLPPGEFGLPFLGETLNWLFEGTAFNSNRRKKYGNVFKTNVIYEPMVRVTGHDFVKEVLSGEHDKVTTVWPFTVRTLLGENTIANSLGSVHYFKRKIASKAFTRTALNSYVPIVIQNCGRTLEALSHLEAPKAYDKMLRMTFDIAINALVGLDIQDENELQKLFQVFYEFVNNLFCLPFNIPGLGFHKALKARAQLLEMLQAHVIKKKREILERLCDCSDAEDEIFRDAFGIIQFEDMKRKARLSAELADKDIINNNNIDNAPKDEKDDFEKYQLSDLEMKEMILELVFAGYFTTSSALTSALLELSRNKHVFQNLEEELLRHGLLEDGDGSASAERMASVDTHDLYKLQYLDQVVKETLRIRPPILGGYRRARKTFQLGNYRIPKGWTVVYNIRDTHEFESEDMETFDPDRFSAVGKDGKENKFRFLPFGCGPRLCIGQEFAKLIIKISLIEMVRRFEGWELVGDNPPKMKAIPVLHPADGLPLKLNSRKQIGVKSV